MKKSPQTNAPTSQLRTTDTDHVPKTAHAVAAYGFSLILLVIAIVVSYSILQNILSAQRVLTQTSTVVSDLKLSIVDTGSTINDLKLELKKENPNFRLIQLIQRRAKDSLKDLNRAQNQLINATGKLRSTEADEDLGWLADYSNSAINRKLESYMHQAEVITDADYTAQDINLQQIPADAAGAKYGAIFNGYRDASAQLDELIQAKSASVVRSHKLLTASIIGVFLAVSLLVVAPLWRRLIVEHKKLKDAHTNLYQIAYTDRETGLPNLDGLESRLNELVKFNDSSQCFYLLLIRINNLDELYNLIGSHQVEALLQSVSKRLESWSPEDQQWCRSGEAEFSSVISETKFQQADEWVQAFHNALTGSMKVAGVMVRPEVSMAVSRIKKSEAFRANCLWQHQSNARLASLGFEPPACWLPEYSPGLNDKLTEQNNLINRISEGISTGQFVPYYQIKVDANTGAPCSIEVLARWVQPDGSVVSPGIFIPAAESSGLIVPLTYSLFEQVQADVSQWCAEGLHIGRVAINIACDVLHHADFISKLKVLHQSLPRQCEGIEVEITENIAIDDNLEKTEKMLNIIRALGIHVAIDDFGTGYASLQTLIDMPVDVLKIDRSFVLPMTETGSGSEVVSAMISLSNKLNKRCVVEGIETEWQWHKLAELGADELQGFYFHRPADAVETATALHEAFGWKVAS